MVHVGLARLETSSGPGYSSGSCGSAGPPRNWGTSVCVGQFDVVDVEEHAERAPGCPTGGRGERVPVDQTVVVAVDAGAGVLGWSDGPRRPAPRRRRRAGPTCRRGRSRRRGASDRSIVGAPRRRRTAGTGGRRRRGPSPSTTTRATISGNSVPPWKRTFLPLPFWASLAAFLVDDEEGATTSEASGAGIGFGGSARRSELRSVEAELGEQPVVGRARPRRATRVDHPPRPGRAPELRPRSGSSSSDRIAADERVGIVGGDGEAAARLLEDPRDRGAGVDRRERPGVPQP